MTESVPAVAALVLTLACYLGFRRLQASFKSPLLNPVLMSILVLVPLLLALDWSYDSYMLGGRWLHYLLEPAVVALAWPLYQQMGLIRAQWKLLLLSCTLGSVLAMAVTLVLAWLLGATPLMLSTLAPKAVTTPIAMDVASLLGGAPSLTAVLVILAGITGAVLGPAVLTLAGVTDAKARGLAMGATAHAVGTARMVEESDTAAAFSGLALILCGIITALLAPVLVPWIQGLLLP